jgi:replicative DNA helicase
VSSENLDTSFELALLAGVGVRGQSDLSEIRRTITPGALHDARARALLEAYSELSDAGLPLDPVSLAATLERNGKIGLLGGLRGINELRQRDQGEAARAGLIERITQHARVGGIQVKLAELARTGLTPEAKDNPARYFAAVSQVSDQAREHVRTSSFTANKSAEIAFKSFIAKKDKAPSVSTGIVYLDMLLNGGWRPKRVAILGARPGVGKTAFAITSMITGAKQRHPQLMFSREMPVEDIVGRAVCQMADVDVEIWEQGPNRATGVDVHRLTRALGAYASLPIEINTEDDELGGILAQIRIWLDTTVARLRENDPHLIPVVWIDYLQECKVAGKHANRDTMLGAFMSGLKDFARAYGVAINVVAACNRDSAKENRPPRSSDLRECGQAEYHASVILLFHRDHGADPDEPEDAGTVVHADGLGLLDKNRQGRPGLVRLTWTGNRGLWHERVSGVPMRSANPPKKEKAPKVPKSAAVSE